MTPAQERRLDELLVANGKLEPFHTVLTACLPPPPYLCKGVKNPKTTKPSPVPQFKAALKALLPGEHGWWVMVPDDADPTGSTEPYSRAFSTATTGRPGAPKWVYEVLRQAEARPRRRGKR